MIDDNHEIIYVNATTNAQQKESSLLAQLVERETVNLEAVGSIPTQRAFVLCHKLL